MFCQKCGAAVPDDATFCPSCSAQVTGQAPPPSPPQYGQYAQPQYVQPQNGQYIQTPAYPAAAPVADWVTPGIIACIFGCCCPVCGTPLNIYSGFASIPAVVAGILSVIFAAKANSQASWGKIEAAQKSLDVAKVFFYICVGITALVLILDVVGSVVGMAIFAASGN